MILKLDGSNLPFSPDDFSVGLDIGICGRSIRIYDCDDYTRQYFGVSINLKRFIDNLYLESRQISGVSLGMPRRCLCCFM